MNTVEEATIEYFNIAELDPVEGWPGAYRLVRFPAGLNPSYRLGGKVTARDSVGCELRFVPEQWQTRVRLSCATPARVHFFQGAYWRDVLEMETGRIYDWDVNLEEALRAASGVIRTQSPWSTDMVRLQVESGAVHLHAIDSFGFPIRVPKREEQPSIRWLAYGSSITHASTRGYVFQAAARLGVDVLDKGMSGSCGVEPETARFLAEDCDWDFATLEWGINLRTSIDPDEFEGRVEASLDSFLKSGKPVFLITIFPNGSRWGDPRQVQFREREEAFDDVLRRAHARRNASNFHLIEGNQIVERASWLAGDLVHPTVDGHNLMGEQLAGVLAQHGIHR